MTLNIFVYGVLMYEELLTQLTGKVQNRVSATLADHQRYNLNMPDWPKIPVVVSEAGSSVQGFVLLDVDAESMCVLDDFEDGDIGLYRRTTTSAKLDAGGTLEVFVYVGTELAQGKLSGVWCEREFMQTHYAEYRDELIPEFLDERTTSII